MIPINNKEKNGKEKRKIKRKIEGKTFPVACGIKICFPLKLVELLLSVSYYDCLVEYFLCFEFLSFYLLFVIDIFCKDLVCVIYI